MVAENGISAIFPLASTVMRQADSVVTPPNSSIMFAPCAAIPVLQGDIPLCRHWLACAVQAAASEGHLIPAYRSCKEKNRLWLFTAVGKAKHIITFLIPGYHRMPNSEPYMLSPRIVWKRQLSTQKLNITKSAHLFFLYFFYPGSASIGLLAIWLGQKANLSGTVIGTVFAVNGIFSVILETDLRLYPR